MDFSVLTPSCPTLPGTSVLRGTDRSSARVPSFFITGICLIVRMNFFNLDISDVSSLT